MTSRFAVVLIVGMTAAGSASQKPSFSRRAEAVRVDVLVTDGDRP